MVRDMRYIYIHEPIRANNSIGYMGILHRFVPINL